MLLLLLGWSQYQDVKEWNVFFNDTLNTFYLRLNGLRHMVKDQAASERGNLLPPHWLLFPISSKGSFIYHRQNNTYLYTACGMVDIKDPLLLFEKNSLCSGGSRGALAGTRNSQDANPVPTSHRLSHCATVAGCEWVIICYLNISGVRQSRHSIPINLINAARFFLAPDRWGERFEAGRYKTDTPGQAVVSAYSSLPNLTSLPNHRFQT